MTNFGVATFTAVLNNTQLLAQAATTKSALTGIGQGMATVGSALTAGVTLPIIGLGIAGVNSAVSIQEAWNEVRKTYNATPEEIEAIIAPTGELGMAVTDLSRKYGIQRENVIGILSLLSAMGFTGAEATDALTKGVEYATAAGIELEDGLSVVISLMQTFQLEGEELQNVMYGLNLTENETAANGFDLSIGLARAGGAAEALTGPMSSANDAVASIASGMAVLKERGQETYRSADALRAIFQRLYIPGTQVQALFDKMGTDVKDAEGNLKPFPTLLKDIATNWDKLSQVEQLEFTKKAIGVEFGPLFGQLIEDVKRGVDSGNESLSTFLDTFNQFGDSAQGQQKFMTELEVAQNSLATSIGRIKAAWGELIDVLTPVIAPLIKQFADFFEKLIDWFKNLDPAAQRMVLFGAAIAAAIGPVLVVIGGLIAILPSLASGLSILTGFAPVAGIFGAIKGAAGGLVGIFSTIGSSLAGFGRLLLLFTPLGRIFAPLVTAFQALGRVLAPLGRFLLPILRFIGLTNPWVAGIMLVVGAILALTSSGENAAGMFEGLRSIWEKIVQVANDVWSAIQPIVEWVRNVAGANFAAGFQSLFSAFQRLLPILKPIGVILGGVIVGAITILSFAFRALGATIEWLMNTIIGPIVDAIVAAFEWLFNILVGNSIIPDMINAIGEWFGKLIELIKVPLEFIINLVKTIFQGIADFIGTVFEGIGTVVSTIFEGIKSVITTVLTFIYNIVVAYLTFLKAFWTAVWNGIVTVVQFVWNLIVTVVKAAIEFVKAIIQAVMQFILVLWVTAWNAVKAAVEFVMNSIRAIIQLVMNVILTIIRTVMAIIQAVWTAIWNAIKAAVEFVWNVIRTIVQTAINVVLNIIRAVMAILRGDWEAAWNAVKAAAQAVWEGIKSVINAAINFVKTIISSGMSAVSSIWNSAWGALTGIVSSVWSTIKGIVSGAISFISGLISGLFSRFQSLISLASNVGSAVGGFVGKVFGASTGGLVPGRGRGDSVPFLLEPGEFIVRREAVESVGVENIAALNAQGSGAATFLAQQMAGLAQGAATRAVMNVPTGGGKTEIAVQTAVTGIDAQAATILTSIDTHIQQQTAALVTALPTMGGDVYVDRSRGDVNLTINNPVPEKASDSLYRASQRLAVSGLDEEI